MRWIGLVLMLGAVAEVQAKVTTKTIEYSDGETVLQGFLAYDDAQAGKRPGVLVAHEWWGLNDFSRGQAEKLAEMGYVALAIDMYGKGVTTTDREEAARLAGQFKQDTNKLRQRVGAGLEALRTQEQVAPQKIAAIGFCFGGTTVLQLAYSGADVAGVVSFHGGLVAPQESDLGKIRARFLVLHGADDPFVAATEIAQFQEGMRKARADWQMVYYGNAVHSFTNPGAKGEIPGAVYDEKAAARSTQHMRAFLAEIFGR